MIWSSLFLCTHDLMWNGSHWSLLLHRSEVRDGANPLRQPSGKGQCGLGAGLGKELRRGVGKAGNMTRGHKVRGQGAGPWGLESSACYLPSPLSLPDLALASEQEVKLHFDLGFRETRLCESPHLVGVWFMSGCGYQEAGPGSYSQVRGL